MKLGFVGYGAQAQENLIPCCRTLGGIEIAAICDRDEAQRAIASRNYDADIIFDDYQEMIMEADLDAIIVACYPKEHFEVATFAMDHRLPVFVEKPPAPSSLHLEKMIELAGQSGVTTGVGMNFRFASVTRQLRAVSEGQIDCITLRHFCNKPTAPFWNQANLLQSFLYSQSIHSLDFLIDLCGPVRDVAVTANNSTRRILMTVMLRFSSGASASLITSNTSPHFVFDFDAIAMGKRHVSSSSLWQLEVSEVGKVYNQAETKKWTDAWAPSPLDSGFVRSGYAGQMIEFLTAVREQREASISFKSLRETYGCMDKIEESLRADQQVLARRAS
ncbi:MAG: Gfo/Idh/MocA family oxidoreductase [Paracoccaceae bacterium]